MWWSCLVAMALAGEPDTVEEQGFYAGSYGRAQATFDLTGGRGDPINLAAHGPRIEQGPYLELDLGWRTRTAKGAKFNVLVTPALSGDVFHYTGQFNAQLAVRNLYAEARDFVPGAPITVWAGSRMYRGDDIYLLDFWPMDNLNTLGGGIDVHPGRTEVAWQIGTNRLLGGDFQVQYRKIQAPDRVDGREILFLDRQRLTSSLRASHHFVFGDLTLRVKAYGEVHALPAGDRLIQEPFSLPRTEALPRDLGGLGGLQLSLWGWAPQSFVHLWFRHSAGLAAYGELTVPTSGLAADRSTKGAASTLIGFTGNTESHWVGVMAALYAEHRRDADGQKLDYDDRWDVVGVIRPNVWITDHVTVGVELSHQHVRPQGANPWTGRWEWPDITKIGIMPAVQLGRGGYARPRVQLVYQASFLDDAAVATFAPGDARVSGKIQHFMGLGAEWWVNAQRVITPSRPDEPVRP